MGDIQIGFSMHPHWASGTGLKEFISPLRSAGLSSLEFELDDHLDLWAEFLPLMEQAVDLGLDLSFHAPYRAPHSLAGFTSGRREMIEQEYRPLLDIAADWSRRTGKPRTVVIHAAAAPMPALQEELFTDTLSFLDWVLITYPSLLFALENNHPSAINQVKIGVNREDVLRIIATIDHPRLHACWDMGHDYLNGAVGIPESGWLSQVIHVHLHDVDENGTDHYPLIYGNVPCHPWLTALKQVGMKGIVVLELKGGQMKDWQPGKIQQSLVSSVGAIAEVTG